jgi:hypothetical protein
MCEPTRKLLIRAYRGRGLICWFVRWQTRSPYSHVALQFGDTFFESHPWRGGFIQCDMTDADRAADAFGIEVPERIYLSMFAWASLHVGCGYDWLAIFRFISRRRYRSNNRWICSEWIFRAFLDHSIRLFNETEEWEVSPGLLVRSPLLAREA